uniref:Uncharacterized protein n=1 Tax=Neobodo designis TaxID=312471 RepID=A0A7S1MJR5_NEODS|mmetsp:Transcript_41859/g.129362  ORF Transcript_41859/g.129362 Transcript_41859/m.129362 type:complete len:231 (+) Transcript_41859:147-839(+)|eukprot:CAMPEP_0174829500 /NCGR_PEP_ID=MMETSP1114-20130205/1959_1 /TAXON_ID=312471 /ORGANISM="Neobodo designis, Strain CCAP 1951/1" /LENGTH=230 /DNA_ID=CAMNT_0016063249 /DNA_START=147 /DNA_END=839 /DNA_ORIENTATION=+
MRALILLALAAAVASAQTGPWCAGNKADTIYDSPVYTNAESICGASDGIPCDMPTMISGRDNSAYMLKYRNCAPTGPSMDRCCVDECAVRKLSSCTTAHGSTPNTCMFVQGQGNTKMCMVRDKVCRMITNSTQCDIYSFCKFENSQCIFATPTIPQGAAGDSVKDKCPALHPVVIAMLALMFVTFVGAVVLVAVVVYRNQKKFDEEEERRAQIEAATAEAKRARKNRNTL